MYMLYMRIVAHNTYTTYAYVCVRICMCACVCVYIYMCVYIYTCTCIINYFINIIIIYYIISYNMNCVHIFREYVLSNATFVLTRMNACLSMCVCRYVCRNTRLSSLVTLVSIAPRFGSIIRCHLSR